MLSNALHGVPVVGGEGVVGYRSMRQFLRDRLRSFIPLCRSVTCSQGAPFDRQIQICFVKSGFVFDRFTAVLPEHFKGEDLIHLQGAFESTYKVLLVRCSICLRSL